METAGTKMALNLTSNISCLIICWFESISILNDTATSRQDGTWRRERGWKRVALLSLEKPCPSRGRLTHMPPHHSPRSSSLCLHSLKLNPSSRVGEKLICELCSRFFILQPLDKVFTVFVSASVSLFTYLNPKEERAVPQLRQRASAGLEPE